MLARQHCIRQACRAGFTRYPVRSAYLTPATVSPWQTLLQDRSIVTAAKAKERVGVAAILNSLDTPTVVEVKDTNQLGKKAMKNLTIEYNHGLQDPWKLAQAVTGRLEKDRLAEAAGLVRIASKDMQVPAAWNHLIDYQLKHQRLHAAFKLYNEVCQSCLIPSPPLSSLTDNESHNR